MKEKSCGAIVINEGKVLLIQSIEGRYGFPKGHMEANETEQQTAIREVKEETDIDIIIDSDKTYSISYLVKGNIPKEVIYFIAHPSGSLDTKPQVGEIKKVLWTDIYKVDNMLEFDNIKRLWQQILKNMI